MPDVLRDANYKILPAPEEAAAFGAFSTISECCGSGLAEDIRYAIGSDWGNKGIVLSVNDFPVEAPGHPDYVVDSVKVGKHYFNILLNMRTDVEDENDDY